MEPNREVNIVPPSGNSLETFFEKNWKTLSIVILALILVLGFFFFNKALKQNKLQEDGEELVSASLSNDSFTKLKKLADDKEKTITGGNALLLLANKHIEKNPPALEEAKDALERFVSDFKDSPLYYDGLFALATLNEELGNNEVAARLYKEVNIPENSAAPASAIRLADSLFKEGKYNEAKKAYESIGSTSSFASVFNKTASTKLSSTKEKILLTENPPPSPEPEPTPPEPEPTPPEPEPTPPEPEPTPEPKESIPK